MNDNEILRKELEHQEDLQRLRGFRPIDDDFMRSLFRKTPELVQLVLRIITGKPDLIVESFETQADMKRVTGARTICLDAYATDAAGKKYDIEVQRADRGASPHRARYHSSVMDVENLDYDALAQAVNNDKQYYEDKAIEMGVSTETAMEVDQKERTRARQEKEEARTLEQQRIAEHIQKLEQQGEAMKATFPNFDLRKELQNPAFARMTSPNVGVSVEDAYYAVHRREIQAAAMQVTAQKTAQKISNSIQAGQRRPVENGTSGQAASVTTFDYSKASKAERDALKQRIREAAARGEKIYPGR